MIAGSSSKDVKNKALTNPINVKEGRARCNRPKYGNKREQETKNGGKETNGKKNEVSKEMGKMVRAPMGEGNKQEDMLKNEFEDARKKRITLENNLYNVAIRMIHKLE